ncbi:hypothetical protein GCM10025856_08460 [Methylophaga marina]|nr:hypothetical protein GCM10025856_08460 [Methylophaga marina]
MASIYQRNLTHYNLQLDLKEEIQLRRLDNYINEHDIAHIDFIKIDIEGHELRALEGEGIILMVDILITYSLNMVVRI